ncbi:MAG: hypothetical protein QOJ49_530, partial [Actinomycetota bacterium]|nr:hypothetical protein [Actinomycetota bacterium]
MPAILSASERVETTFLMLGAA